MIVKILFANKLKNR